jgi:membrane protease YdiL (CAAX protease family)
MLKRYSLIAFFALAYALTWLAWMPLALRGPVFGDSLSYLHFLGSLGPLVSAFVMTGLVSGRSGVRELLERVFRWRVRLGWHLVAWFGPAALYAIAAVVVRVVVWGQWPKLSLFGHSEEFAQLAMPVYWMLSLICYGFGEEVGWRGFALPRLQQKYSALTSAVILSVFWALWHLPVFAFSTGLSQMGPAEIFGWYLSLLTGSLLLTWMCNGARGSVLIVAVFHAMLDVAMTSPAPASLSNVVGALLTIWGVFSIRALVRPRPRNSGPKACKRSILACVLQDYRRIFPPGANRH